MVVPIRPAGNSAAELYGKKKLDREILKIYTEGLTL